MMQIAATNVKSDDSNSDVALRGIVDAAKWALQAMTVLSACTSAELLPSSGDREGQQHGESTHRTRQLQDIHLRTTLRASVPDTMPVLLSLLVSCSLVAVH